MTAPPEIKALRQAYLDGVAAGRCQEWFDWSETAEWAATERAYWKERAALRYPTPRDAA
jgi:hypothetical protein